VKWLCRQRLSEHQRFLERGNRAEKLWSARCRCAVQTDMLGTRRRLLHTLIGCYTTSPLEKARERKRPSMEQALLFQSTDELAAGKEDRGMVGFEWETR